MSFSKVPVKQFEWIDTQRPSNEEIATFAREAKLLHSDVEFLLEDQPRPEVAVRADYVLILVRVPVFDKKTRVTSGASVAFITTKDRLYTLHTQPVVVLEQVRQEIEDHPNDHEPHIGENTISLALYIIDKLGDSSFRKLTRLTKHIDIAEDAVFFGNERKMVEEVAILGRDVLDFRRIVRPHISLFKNIPDILDENTASQWRRVGGQMEQLWELLESLYNSAKELRETNDSLLQHKENELLRLLTLYSIVAIPALLLAGSYNSGAPTFEVIFWVVLLFLVFCLGFVFLRAKRRKII
ncbi:MAG: hypothetical protein HYR90_04640 [Candidatus Andersenbacteria bacterium]|nr:hypothetical protein [Candidatus Andersenbacteria bacterium]MBI3250440.1 hypothetical protein [Candidatus Andersenbacteria bacterium]